MVGKGGNLSLFTLVRRRENDELITGDAPLNVVQDFCEKIKLQTNEQLIFIANGLGKRQ